MCLWPLKPGQSWSHSESGQLVKISKSGKSIRISRTFTPKNIVNLRLLLFTKRVIVECVSWSLFSNTLVTPQRRKKHMLMLQKQQKLQFARIAEKFIKICFAFLDASSHFYMRVCPSVRPSVRPYVHASIRMSARPSVRMSVHPLAFQRNRQKIRFQPGRRILLPAGA